MANNAIILTTTNDQVVELEKFIQYLHLAKESLDRLHGNMFALVDHADGDSANWVYLEAGKRLFGASETSENKSKAAFTLLDDVKTQLESDEITDLRTRVIFGATL